MLLQYTKVNASSATVEVRTLMLMLFVVFVINTPLGIVKREKIDTFTQQVKVADETFQARKKMVSSYLSLADTAIAKQYFDNPNDFDDLVEHLLQAQSLVADITILDRVGSQSGYAMLLYSYNSFYRNPDNASVYQTLFWPEQGVFTEIAPVYRQQQHIGYLIVDVNVSDVANSFRQDTLLLDTKGFVYSSSYDQVAQLSRLPSHFLPLAEQLSRTARSNGVLEFGDYTAIYRKSAMMNNEPSYLVKLVANDQLIPRYAYLLMLLIVISIGVTYFLYRMRKDKQLLSKMTYTDELSGLHNRHYLNKVSKQLKSNQYYLGVFDIDHFKSVNDRYGHDIGDQVIRRVAEAIKRRIRVSDFAFRMGGEEFLVVVKTERDHVAQQIFERIRQDVAQLSSEPKVTISVGGSKLTHSFAQALKSADCMLYKAKHGGRNRVCIDIYDEPILKRSA